MSTKPQPKSNITAEKLALYEKLIATHPAIERKGDRNPYTSVNGHMFTYLDPTSALVGIRLASKEREEFLKRYKSTLFEAYGGVMKEFVTVPDALLKNTKELQKYVAASYEYTKTLKPRPSRKKK
jgi:hypothetical protein